MAVSLSNWAHLGGKGKGNLVAVWLSEDNLVLFNCVGSVFKLGNIEALTLFDFTTNNLGNLDDLGDTVPDLLWSSNIDGDDERTVDERHRVLLGLILFPAKLVFAGVSVRFSIPGSTACGNAHRLSLCLRCNLLQIVFINSIFLD